MPTLFDSHDEFSEWFSKDIESHAENKSGIDESKPCPSDSALLKNNYINRKKFLLPNFTIYLTGSS